MSWSADGGTIDANGLYVAPQTPGRYTIVAVSHADASKRATAEVDVGAGIAVAISPAAVQIEEGVQQRFIAAANGSDTRVTWSLAEAAGGTVDANGLYTAPRGPGTFHVVATSVADPSHSIAAAVTVIVPAVSVTLTPVAITIRPGANLHFTAAAVGAADTRLQWASDCCASIAQDGSFTAPAAPGTYHLIARSTADPAQFASATIIVQTAAAIDPAAVTLAAGDHIAFTASRPATTWSVQEGAQGGSISSGVYQAPYGHGGTFHVIATGEGWTATVEVTVLPADLADGGGPVVARTRTFAIFWGDPGAWAADVRPTQEAVLRGLDGSDHLRIAEQYLRGAAAGTSFGGSFSDPSAPPASPDKADHQTVGAAACAALQAGGIVPAAGDVAIVYSAASFSPAPSWCAWHSFFVCGNATLLIAFIPNVKGSYGCLKLGASIGCNTLSDESNAAASFAVHELFEAMTDPLLSAWTDAAGEEIGDKCEEPRCIALSTGAFQLQAEYSNAIHACAP